MKSCITEIKGDLFQTLESSSLAHCVSRDLEMGKGIAVIFKEKFGNVDALKLQNKKVGECAFLDVNGKYVYYLITKEKYWNKPTYTNLKSSLLDMKQLAVQHKITKLSMPKIGAGLDKLDWDKVKQIITDVFTDTSIDITIYCL